MQSSGSFPIFRGSTLPFLAALAFALALLACPASGWAQNGGASSVGGFSMPDGVAQKDTLKDFHHAMAVQATNQQIAQFQAMVKNTEAAKAALNDFLEKRKDTQTKSSAPVDKSLPDSLKSALAQVREDNRLFQQALSDDQKLGLKDISKRLDRADSDLDQETAKLAQSVHATAPPTEILSLAENLNKALSDFSDEQSALGREMSIVFATPQDLTFRLLPVSTPVHIDSQTVNVIVAGQLSQLKTDQDGRRTFRLDLEEDLSDLQQNVTPLMRQAVDRGTQCGERIAVRQAMLTPSTPSSLILLQLHYERWSCVRLYGQTSQTEIAENDASVEVKLTPEVVAGTLQLKAAFGQMAAAGMLADSLKSGDLGDDLRKDIADALLPSIRAAMDFKTVLPAALENATIVQTAEFHDAGAGVLRVTLQGQAQISTQQANLLANQLNQALAAKADTGAATVPPPKSSSQ